MIRLFVVRHAIAAEPARFPGSDAERPLTEKGRRRMRRVARAFARLGESVELLVSSPLVRAVQTAEILAGALGHDSVELSPALGPGEDPQTMVRALVGRLGEGRGAMVVGHEPQLSRLLAHLARLPAAEGARLALRKGSIVRIDLDARGREAGQPRWWMRPKSRELHPGMPVSKSREQATHGHPRGETSKRARGSPAEE